MKKIASLFLLASSFIAQAQDTLSNSVLNSLSFRNIGPATTSGRIVDIAVDNTDFNTYYIAAAYSGVWKTTNNGTTYSPIFDNYGVQSIGCITIDPSNHQSIWVGTGENNNQRSVGYGNGVYLSRDAGVSFTNMGLKNSEHIGMIKVHPQKSNIIYVAAYGSVWKKGGERGLYKSEDEGKTWSLIKSVSEYTGCNEVHIDPTNPEIIYASFHQRQRKQWTYLGGGPESALFKSTDGGKTWNTITRGLPGGDKGRISLAIAAQNPEKLYCMVETDGEAGGLFVSIDKGENWNKVNKTYTSGNYYCEIMADPMDANKLFIMDTYLKITTDGGNTVNNVGEHNKHVDNHCIWVNPKNTAHWRVGCDGGLYETYDNGSTYNYKENLPLTQFYRVALDNDLPFYNVYGGTQDNNTLGGPSANTSSNGIANSDWFVTVGGDGFKSQVDPQNPNIVYSQWQYGGLVRYDRKTGNIVDIKPQHNLPLRWNWDAPLLISRHNNNVVYYCANVVFKSMDKGNSWQAISGDLTQQVDRNKLKVMDRLWAPEAVAKDESVTQFGTIIYFNESRLDSNLLAAGMDDGSIQLSTDGGENWLKISNVAAPIYSHVSSLHFDRFDKNTLYASWDNHKDGDFKPYIYMSTDLGKTWKLISANLPSNGAVKSFAQDFEKKELLFCGTEFGIYTSPNGGNWWGKLSGGLAPIPVMDIEIQERECDLVLATFGRGFAILDNYAPLRHYSSKTFNSDLQLLPIKDAKLFVNKSPLGGNGNSSKGASYFQMPNPSYGATLYFWVKDVPKSPKQLRQEKEKQAISKKVDFEIANVEELRKEQQYINPFAIISIYDYESTEVRRIKVPVSVGINKVNWDLKHEYLDALKNAVSNDAGFLVNPGNYKAQVKLVYNGTEAFKSNEMRFNVKEIEPNSIELMSNAQTEEFIKTYQNTRLEIVKVGEELDHSKKRLTILEKAVNVPDVPSNFLSNIKDITSRLDSLQILVQGDALKDKYEKERVEGLDELLGNPAWALVGSTAGVSKTHIEMVLKVQSKLAEIKVMQQGINQELSSAESTLQALGIYLGKP